MGTIEIASETLHRSLAGEAVLINLTSGIWFRLDPTGSRIWELIQAHGDQARIERQLVREFDAEPETIAEDVAEFLRQLVEKGLITVAEAVD